MLEVCKFFLEAAEVPLSDTSQIGFDLTNDIKMKQTFPFLREYSDLLGTQESTGNALDINTELRARSSSFMIVYAHKALTSTHSTRHVAANPREKVKD